MRLVRGKVDLTLLRFLKKDHQLNEGGEGSGATGEGRWGERTIAIGKNNDNGPH